MTNFDGPRTQEGVEGFTDLQFEQLDPLEQARLLQEAQEQIEAQIRHADARSAEQLRKDLDRIDAAREIALARAKGSKVEIMADEEKTVHYGRGTVRPILGPLGLFGMRTAEFAGDKIKNTPQRLLSGLFTRLEQKGSDMIKKNAPWVEMIPYVGPWLLKKAEKSLAEREKEEAEKRKKDDEKKQKEKDADDDLEKALKTAAGDPKKMMRAIKRHRKETAEDKPDKPEPAAKPDKGEDDEEE